MFKRWDFPAPFVQKNLFFRPNSGVTGQVGSCQSLILGNAHDTLLIYAKNRSFAFFTHLLWVGHFGQLHMPLNFSTALFISSGGIIFTSFIICSNLSFVFHLLFAFNDYFPIYYLRQPYFCDRNDFYRFSHNGNCNSR